MSRALVFLGLGLGWWRVSSAQTQTARTDRAGDRSGSVLRFCGQMGSGGGLNGADRLADEDLIADAHLHAAIGQLPFENTLNRYTASKPNGAQHAISPE